MGDTILKTIATTIVVYFITLILSRILGRKLISQFTLFDFIVGIMMGSAAVEASKISKNPSLSAFVVLIVICILTILIDIIHIKSITFRKLFNSEPVVVLEKGKMIDKNMKKIKLSVEELLMLLREKNIFNVVDVESAIMETNGQLSVQFKSERQPLTPSDMSIQPPYKGLTKDVVIDGQILEKNLQYIGKNEQWLKEQLKSYDAYDVSEVFYAGLDSSGNFYVSKKLHNSETAGKHGTE